MARLFTAVLVPDDVEAHLSEAIDAVRDARPDLRWVRPSNWHLTLRFLGECGPREADRQRQHWAGRAGAVAPREMSLGGAGAFPHAWMAKVLWVGVRDGVETFRALAGPDQDPHVTLARVRTWTDLTAVVGELGDYASRPWRVTEVALVESHLRRRGERGPRYEVLERFSLGVA